MDTYMKQYTTLGIGAAGVYASAPNEHSSYYTSISIPDSRLTPYLGDLAEAEWSSTSGRVSNVEDFDHMVVNGPLLHEGLPAGFKQSAFGRPSKMLEGEKLGSFDYIALDIYLDIWRKAGAKIGKRVGNTIQWEDGSVFPIPPSEERFQHEEHG